MGRKRYFNLEKYVEYDLVGDISKCLMCNKQLKGKLAGNIRRHYQKVHLKNIQDIENADETSLSSGSSVSRKRKSSQITIHMDKNDFLKCCVRMVTVKNLPFRIFDDEEYFKKMLRPYEEHFTTSINSKSVVEKMCVAAREIKKSIAKNVHKKMVSLKIDIATRLEKSILGINIQYIKDSEININTIGMIQLRRRHTAQFLKEEILNCLKDFNIDVTQLYSSTTDNGANVIKTSKLLQELQEEMQIHSNEDAIPPAHNSDDENEFLEIHSQLTSVMAVVRCAAHTIQLAAHDVLKIIPSQVDDCRKAVKALRTIIRNNTEPNLQMPLLDNLTRWNSTFSMFDSLSKLKSYVQNLSDFNGPDVDWNFVENFIEAFKPLAECTVKLQHEQYFVGDFYRDWLYCEVELEEKNAGGNIYAAQLLKAMNMRKCLLLENGAFIAAIFLDPRFNFINTPFLTEIQKQSAVEHLLKTNVIIKRLVGESQGEENVSDIGSPTTSFSTRIESSGPFSKLEAKMNLLIEQGPSRLQDTTMKQKLEYLCNNERIPFEANLLEYWRNVKYKDPELALLIDVALAVPSTQVSVERAFSALSTILTKTRSKLSKETINNLLLIKLNSNLLEKITISEE